MERCSEEVEQTQPQQELEFGLFSEGQRCPTSMFAFLTADALQSLFYLGAVIV